MRINTENDCLTLEIVTERRRYKTRFILMLSPRGKWFYYGRRLSVTRAARVSLSSAENNTHLPFRLVHDVSQTNRNRFNRLYRMEKNKKEEKKKCLDDPAVSSP